MARRSHATGPLPPPLPPETRTVGQLVAETLKLYSQRFWPSLALGLGLTIADLAIPGVPRAGRLLLEAVLLTGSYMGASVLALGARPDRRSLLVAFAGGVLVFLPFPFLALLYVLPGFAWLALVGLVVPVALAERRGLRGSFARAFALARTDYAHAFFSLATLAITFFLSRFVLFFLLRGQGGAAGRVAALLSDLVLSPLVFLGAALLYVDQAARAVGSGRADVHPALEADRPGRADPEVEPRPLAGGQP